MKNYLLTIVMTIYRVECRRGS